MSHSAKYESLSTGQKAVAEPIAHYLHEQRLCRYQGTLNDAYTDAAWMVEALGLTASVIVLTDERSSYGTARPESFT